MKRFFLSLAALGFVLVPVAASAQIAPDPGLDGPLFDVDVDVDKPISSGDNGISADGKVKNAATGDNGIVAEKGAVAADGLAIDGRRVNDVGGNVNSPGSFAVGDMDDTVGSSVGFNNRTLSPDLAQQQVFAPNANPGAVTLPGVIRLDGLVGLPTTITTFSPSAEAVNIVESSNFNQNSNVNNSSAFSD